MKITPLTEDAALVKTESEATETPLEAQTPETGPETLPESETALLNAYREALATYGEALTMVGKAQREVEALEAETAQVQARIDQLETRRKAALDSKALAATRAELAKAKGQADDVQLLLANWRRMAQSSEQMERDTLRQCARQREKLIRWKIEQHMAALVPQVEALLPLWLMTAQDRQAQQLATFFALTLPSVQETRQRLTAWFAQSGLPFKPEDLRHELQ